MKSYIPKNFDTEFGYISLANGFTLQLNKELNWVLIAEDTYYSLELKLETEEQFKQFLNTVGVTYEQIRS